MPTPPPLADDESGLGGDLDPGDVERRGPIQRDLDFARDLAVVGASVVRLRFQEDLPGAFGHDAVRHMPVAGRAVLDLVAGDGNIAALASGCHVTVGWPPSR